MEPLIAPLTVSAVKIYKENLKQDELQHFHQHSVYEFIAKRTALYDQLLIQLWQDFELDKTDFSLIAVGGYGRGEMFPLSDLDFLILTPQPIDETLSQKVSQFVQFLWDCNFEVGHSVRTLVDCEQEGKKDITIATNLLEARYLIGNISLFEQLNQLVVQPDFWPKETFFQAKIAEQKARYQRYHNTSYNLEPDLKHSPGGLRDLHLLYWIALRESGAKNLDEILASGFIYAQEYQQLQQSQAYLFKVRFALHLILKRYDNRLLFDRQIRVAELLGFEGEGNAGVEKMMKHFFQALQQISVITGLLVKHYREQLLPQQHHTPLQQLDSHFALVNQAILLQDPTIFTEKPEVILDLFFHLTAYPEAEIHSSTLRQLQVALQNLQGYLSYFPAAREKFLRLFNQPKAIERAFVPMHRYGVLTAYLPQWKGIEGLMQFDLFHCYTVDEHSLRTMQRMEFFLEQESQRLHPLCHRIFSSQTDRTLCYVAALFHDIAKGRGGDHAILGAKEIQQFAQQHQFEQREIATLHWLVEQHLLMSVTAQRRDIHDPEVVMAFAEQVQNKVRLDLLTCLTVADICATNETLWNSWKRTLITTLYDYTKQQFTQGMDKLLDNQEKIAQHRAQALAILQQSQGVDIAQIEQLWQPCPDEYFLRHPPEQIAWHSSLLLNKTEQNIVKISNRFTSGGTAVFVYCRDRANLFHQLVSIIGAKKFSIHDAQIITNQAGYVLDSFIITEMNGDVVKFDRRRSLETALLNGLTHSKSIKMTSLPSRKLQYFNVKTEVRFLRENRTDYTEMELFTLDQVGLLAKVSQVFSQLDLNLINAKITTIGEKVEDFFMLTNQEGKALNSEQREQLSNSLHQVLQS